MSDEDLKLNSLSRFSKQSPHLILEVYDHCEVPAGCGGVVLRWRYPDEPVPMVMHYFSNNGSLEMDTLDGGKRLWWARIPVSYGTHVFTFEIRDFVPSFAVVLVVAQVKADYSRLLPLEGDTTVLSRPDGTWKYALDSMEGTNWQQPDFDDSAWFPMVEKPVNTRSKAPDNRWYIERVKECTDQGAVGLGIDSEVHTISQAVSRLLSENGTLPRIYIRKTFSIRKKD